MPRGDRMISISIHLYGKPPWDMDIENTTYVDPEMVRRQGDYLKEHLHTAADAAQKLQETGWELADCVGAVYDLYFSKDVSKRAAKKELKALGIDIQLVHIEEWESEEEAEDVVA